MTKLLDAYIALNEHTEPPYNYHRWSILSCVGALLGRQIWLPFGHARIFPNIYVMLLGEPGTRKSTAIKIARKFISSAGYETFAADKTTKEAFLVDLEGRLTEDDMSRLTDKEQKQRIYDATMKMNLWGKDETDTEPKEVFIVADEFNEFTSPGNTEFYTTLGNLWDWDDESRPYRQRVKNSRSVAIYQPTVSILGGNTPEKFAEAFPPAIIGGGFLSRMLIIHGEKSGRKYHNPVAPDQGAVDAVISGLQKLRGLVRGPATIDASADRILRNLYEGWADLPDIRFKSYSTRRYTQVLKLCLILSAMEQRLAITSDIVIQANTILSAAEFFMPRAIGEFGKGKHSDVSNKIMEVIESANKPLTPQDIWLHVHKDLEKITQLGELLQSLAQAKRIQYVKERGWLPLKAVRKKPDHVDWSLLTKEEQEAVA